MANTYKSCLTNSYSMKKIAIIGVGNLLQTDDGIGIWAVDELGKNNLPHNVEVFDASTDPMVVLDAMDNKDKAIVIDAFAGGRAPGTFYRYRIEDLNIDDQTDSFDISLHSMSFLDALKNGKHAYNLPREIVVIGVEPDKIETGMELSKTLKERLPQLIKLVMEEIN